MHMFRVPVIAIEPACKPCQSRRRLTRSWHTGGTRGGTAGTFGIILRGWRRRWSYLPALSSVICCSVMGRDQSRVLICAVASLTLIAAGALVMDWYVLTLDGLTEKVAIDLRSVHARKSGLKTGTDRSEARAGRQSTPVKPRRVSARKGAD